MHKRRKALGYPMSILLACAFVAAMLVSLVFSDSALAAQRSPATAAQHSTPATPLKPICSNEWRGIVRLAKDTLYYGSLVTCAGSVARITLTLVVQIYNNGSWVVNGAAPPAACNKCATLRSPAGIGSYSYTGAPGQFVRVSITFGVRFLDNSGEGESGIAGPYRFT